MEIGWGELDYASERFFRNEADLRKLLRECMHARLRPLILLNAHHGHPVPAEIFEARTAAAAPKGVRSVELASTFGVRPNLTGLCDLGDQGIMAEFLVTRIQGQSLTLSKALPRALRSGETLRLATLRYVPFSVRGSAEYEKTMSGWLRYVDMVGELAGSILGSLNGSDQGFDLEIWNELTFGSAFLSLNNYRSAELQQPRPDPGVIWDDIVQRTARHVTANPRRFAGVALSNGFASTIPWTAASLQPARVSAISKHPYPPSKHFPDEEQSGTALGGDGQHTSYVPTYDVFFPEYLATAIQTETLWRDLSTESNPIYETMHGRLARKSDTGAVLPVDVWITEIGVDPTEHGWTEPGRAEWLRQRFCLRAMIFFLGIGAARVYLFTAFGGPHQLLGQEPSSLMSPTLRTLSRANAVISHDHRRDVPVRNLGIEYFPGDATLEVFPGNHHPATPPLRASDCLTVLPFQSSTHRFVLAYYIMTRDIRTKLPPQQMRLRITGLAGISVAVTATDPIGGGSPHLAVLDRSVDGIVLSVMVTDTPCLLILNEAPV
ncbi:hypothetical protein [Paracraurococcus lichenis]|uniref:Glycoside hydrolase family 5 C-terminal domain-containing protein n=1 Tax=Paracraurococcus lichenis TaxID=3064888 RepID=A0ABT9EBM2_9PROT|nr:hypothetical protein [Paracraurococcus sp. LOR1-02]MDO9713363.1 hypothetical protein [Paracraurococcus sp. LOR1-02]